MRYFVLAAALAVAVSESATAQTPPGALPTRKVEQPVMPTLTLPIEIVKAVPAFFGAMYYERAGLAPREFRVADNPQMTGATWQPLRETGTTKKTVNGRSVTVGQLEGLGIGIGSSCSNQAAWVKAWLQFRSTDPSGRVFVSNIKGDSTCVPLGG